MKKTFLITSIVLLFGCAKTTVPPSQSTVSVYIQRTGQTKSFGVNDDGALKHGALQDFYTLNDPNVFKNNNRFTDENGKQSYPSNYVIDNATGLAWCTVMQGSDNWNDACIYSKNFTLTVGNNTYNDFYIPNVNELLSIARWDDQAFNYAPFNLGSTQPLQLWTSTTQYNNTQFAVRVSIQTFPAASVVDKQASIPFILCRKAF